MLKRLVVIGAGAGGLIVANFVARDLVREIEAGRVNVTLIGDQDTYTYQPGFLYVPFDLKRPGDLTRPVADLLDPAVSFIRDRATSIDPVDHHVERAGGEDIPYDYLVIATGSHPSLADIPGLEDAAHTFYTLPAALQLRDALRDFKGGRALITVGVPHKCPVAPLEFTFMFEDWTRQAGIRERVEITYTYPIGRPHSIPELGEWAAGEFAKRGIAFSAYFNLDSVDGEKKVLHSFEGEELPYDLLVAVPPHRGAVLGEAAHLADSGGWYPTDRSLLHLKDHDDVFVVGDATDLPVPKAGSVADFEAEVVADNLVHLLTEGASRTGRRYAGKSFCFIETGLTEATYISFDFSHPPEVRPPSRAMHWFKETYNQVQWLNVKGVI